MAQFIFVHGGNVSSETWNIIVRKEDYPHNTKLGGQIWKPISEQLKSRGHFVLMPTLTDEYNNGLSNHIEQIVSLIIENKLTQVILVGHSYGGMIITGVTEKLPDRINHLVYIDAALPENGQSLFDLLKLAHIDPRSIIQGEPKAYTEKINLRHNHVTNLSKHYIRCTESDFTSVTALAKQRILAEDNNWNFMEIQTGHLPMASKTKWLVSFLLGLTE